MIVLLSLLPLLLVLPASQVRTERSVYIKPAPIRQQPAWNVSPGVNTVTVAGDEIYMAQREPQNTTQYAIAEKRIDAGTKGKWRVSFDVRMGNLGSTPTGIALYSGKELIGWVGADGFYKVLGTCFGKDYFDTMDGTVFPRADNEWHTITFSSLDNETITIQRDGKTVARTRSKLRPDTIKVGQIHLLFGMEPSNLQQSELTMRNLWAESGDML